jgi:hypothetical protein
MRAVMKKDEIPSYHGEIGDFVSHARMRHEGGGEGN